MKFSSAPNTVPAARIIPTNAGSSHGVPLPRPIKPPLKSVNNPTAGDFPASLRLGSLSPESHSEYSNARGSCRPPVFLVLSKHRAHGSAAFDPGFGTRRGL